MTRHRTKKQSPFLPSWIKHMREWEKQYLAKLEKSIEEGRKASKDRIQLVNGIARRAHQARIEKKAKEAQQQ